MKDNENFRFNVIEIEYYRWIGRSEAPSAGDLLYLIVRDESDAPGECRGHIGCEIKRVEEETVSEEGVRGKLRLHTDDTGLSFRFRGREPGPVPEDPS